MIETTETGNITALDSTNILGYLQLNSYKEILTAFFPDGAKYKNNNLLGTFFSNKTAVDDPKIGTRTSDIDNTFILNINLTTQPIDGTFEVVVKNKETEDVIITIIFDDPLSVVEDSGIITISDTSWDAVTKKLYITFTFPDVLTMPTQGFSFTITNPDTEYYIIKQYLVEDDAPTSMLKATWDALPVLDCSDFASFLWAANKGYIIKKKLFTCQSLIEEKFDQTEDTELVGFNSHFTKYINIEELFENTKNGDIYVFNINDQYHCIFITDINKKEYTECSSFVSFWLGESYNCTINPYPLKDRVLKLFQNTKLYKIRLL